MTSSRQRTIGWFRGFGVVSLVLGVMALGVSIPRAGRNLFTALAVTGLFWQIGVLLLVAGAWLLSLSWLSGRHQ
jgi:hypothetical protein